MVEIRRLSNPAEFVALIEKEQRDPATGCGLFPQSSADFMALLDDACKNWRQNALEVRSNSGLLGGIFQCSDEKLGRGWLFGPWVVATHWDEIGLDLVNAALATVPESIKRIDMCADVANLDYKRIADALGLGDGTLSFAFRCRADKIVADTGCLTDLDLDIRPMTKADIDQLRVLHDTNFPGTYALAEDLLDPVEYTTLVAVKGTELIGYISGAPVESDGYLDFVAVQPDYRRKGVAAALVAALVSVLPIVDVWVVLDERHPEGRQLIEGMDFELVSSSRTYIWEREQSLPST